MAFLKQTIKTVPIEGETVLLRTDFNVPQDASGAISDDFRIRASLPTIRRLIKDGCKVVIISHMGRPEGRADTRFSLEPVAQRLANLLEAPVRFVDQTIGDRVKMAVKRAPKSCVIVLENLRFHPGEEANDMNFARQIANDTGARYFVQDGFGVVHRAHASTAAITQFIPSVGGLLLEREYDEITRAIKTPKRPLVAVIGGAKVSDKIEIIKAFIDKADQIIIGGAMANTFLAYKGVSVGASMHESDKRSVLDEIYEQAKEKVGLDSVDDFLQLPTDVAVAPVAEDGQIRQVVSVESVKEADMALDIGTESITRMIGSLRDAGTVIWNGTLGYASIASFAHGSARLALELATHPETVSIIGGGDTADFVRHWDAKNGESFTHVSTGGGASLELMAGKNLPGIESLLDARR